MPPDEPRGVPAGGFRRTLLLFNSSASRAGEMSVDELQASVAGMGLACKTYSAETPRRFGARLQEEAASIELVIVGGGDGTLNAVVPAVRATGVPLAILPLGTANDLARGLGVPVDPGEALDLLRTGELATVGVAHANDRHFVNVLGIGAGPEMTLNLAKTDKERLGRFAYAIAMLRRAFSAKAFRAHISDGQRDYRVRCVQLNIANGRYFGGGAPIAPDAAPTDGKLRLVAVPADRKFRALLRFLSLWLGIERRQDDLLLLESREYSIHCSPEQRMTVDGEHAGCTPLRVELVPDAMRVLVPSRE